MEEMEKSHETFLQGAQVELKKEMAVLQKEVMMDTVSYAMSIAFTAFEKLYTHDKIMLSSANWLGSKLANGQK